VARWWVIPGLALGVLTGNASGAVPDVSSAPATRPAYTGSSSCRECHESFYEKWSTSRHGLAMQPFTSTFASAHLAPQTQPVDIRGRQYLATLEAGQGAVVEHGPEGQRRYPMEHVLGGKNVYYFLTPLDRGRLQVLPVAFDVRKKEWFDTTASAARGIMNLEDEVLDWRAPQLTFNTSCYGCHVSQLSTNYDEKTDSYHTVWTEPGINCETCHEAGGEHVRLFRGLPPGAKTPEDIKLISTRKFTVEQQNAACAPCHAKASTLTNTFRPGDRFFDHFDLVGPEHSDFYPDGRDLGENYTYTSWRMSPCAKSGQLDCLHCHTSSGRFRFEADPNRSCLPCHEARVANATEHTHHPAGSKGNLCISCHMPMTAFARMNRSDHSMRPPTPAVTAAFKSPNACNLCHQDKDAAWADGYVRQWRPRDFQAPVLHVAGLIDAARKGDFKRLPEMLAYATSPQREEMLAVGLLRALRGCEDGRKWGGFLQALRDSSPLVRAAAAEGLDGYTAPEAVAALLAATGDEYRLVRVRAASALAAAPREGLSPADAESLRRATDEFLAVVQARPDDAGSHYNLGNFLMARREYDRSVAAYERAFRLLPDVIAPLVNASIVHNLAGRNDQAEDCLRRALKVDPGSAPANLNLGLLLGEMGRTDEAEHFLRAAFKADPRSATAAYNLGVLAAADHPAEAIEWCRKAHELMPAEPKYAYTLAFFLVQGGQRDEAARVLRGVTDQRLAYPDAYVLLGRLYEEAGRRDQAVEVYRKASGVEDFPADLRAHFSQRAALLSAAR
jgi:tetratricopeptide (TPR) repeat protein